MVMTHERPAATHEPRPRRFVSIALVVVLIAAMATGVVLLRGSDDEPPVATPDDVVARVATAIAEVDPDTYGGLTHSTQGDIISREIMSRQIEYLRLDPTFSDCREMVVGPNMLRCTVNYGEDYFFSAVVGYNIAGSITVQVLEGDTFRLSAWPFPPEVKTAENELREWIRATHPEVEGDMFGSDAYGVFSFSEEAHRLHAEYRDEYLAFLDS